MMRQVPCPAAVALRGLAGAAEVFDQVFAFFHFLILKFQNGTYTFEGEGQAHIS